MEINVVELIVQAGALGLTALLLYGLWRYGGAFVTRLMDNLDQQTMNYEATIRVQAEVASTLGMLCKQIDGCEENHSQRGKESSEALAEMVKALEELGERMRAHEVRAASRYEQQMKQANERHAELVSVLQGLNGK